ncbi:MAG TPA: thiamine phosphate synthase [Thermoanaerobaculia bacterium]|nr:thiamine phosphate synthase [Thermoanaerobaculia bacterium]
MKALYVTDRASAGDSRLKETLSALADATGLSVQLREKNTSDRECLGWARLARATLGTRVSLFVNRRFDIALAAGADGVHLPASGLPVPRVRAETPRGFRVGVSTHSPAEAAARIGEGADLVLIGPVFDTPSKRAYGPPLGEAALGELPEQSGHACEVFAIGGISEENLWRLDPYRDRIAGIAGVRLFQEARDPRAVLERIARR